MKPHDRLLARLDAIGDSLQATGNALALIGLGSVGLERERIDAYSDLDFFVIAKEGCKQAFLADLAWLSCLAPIAYAFQNSVDGYKAFYADGIFCEFAIFERAELVSIPFSRGRIVWKAADVDENIAIPVRSAPPLERKPIEWLVGEALTNLFVGVGRDRRGEKLAALRLIQSFAVDRVLELMEHLETAQASERDEWAPERRYEQRYPTTAQVLPTFMQGYERNRESASAILAFLEQHVSVNSMMAQAIRAGCAEDMNE